MIAMQLYAVHVFLACFPLLPDANAFPFPSVMSLMPKAYATRSEHPELSRLSFSHMATIVYDPTVSASQPVLPCVQP